MKSEYLLFIIFCCMVIHPFLYARIIWKGTGDKYIPGFETIKKEELSNYDMKKMRWIQVIILSIIMIVWLVNIVIICIYPDIIRTYSFFTAIRIFLLVSLFITKSKIALWLSKKK